jgi:hypothetical protein
METKPTLYKIPKMSRDLLDEVKVGDWFWVKIDDTEWDGDKRVKAGDHEELMCVEAVGSNYVGFTRSEPSGTSDERIHFDHFFARCRSEPDWKNVLQKRMHDIQKAIQDKTQELVEQGQKLCLLNQPQASPAEVGSLLPVKVADEPKRYKKELVKLKSKTLPAISKQIEKLAEDFAVAAKDMALPDLVKLQCVKDRLGIVEDRIFTIELYCGLLEEVHQLAEGKPAPMSEKIAIRQALLYMDEETLFDYEDGGMDINSLKAFDKWVVKPENLNRVLPEQKAVVAFQVRREDKEYGEPSNIMQAWSNIQLEEANKWTYLLIRNGENVYRIVPEIDFKPRLIPKRNEIGEEQFKKITDKYIWKEDEPDKKWGIGGDMERVEVEELITPDHVEYDDYVKKVDRLLKQYNRIVILIQGLLDRSQVFSPHPPIKLTIPGVMDEWVRLIRDEEDGLPCNRVTFQGYQAQLNRTLRKGKWVFVDNKYDEHFKYGWRPYHEELKWTRSKRGWQVNDMPQVCKVDSMNKDGTQVRVSWPWGNLSNPKKGKWIENPKRPGWGHHELIWTSDRICHESIPINRVLNVSDYNLGDYKMFLCDRGLRGKYLEWSQYLLNAEDWARNRAKGIPPEKDKKTQVKN